MRARADLSSIFTAEAREPEPRRVGLIALKALLELSIRHYPRIDEDERRLLPLRPVHFLAPND